MTTRLVGKLVGEGGGADSVEMGEGRNDHKKETKNKLATASLFSPNHGLYYLLYTTQNVCGIGQKTQNAT